MTDIEIANSIEPQDICELAKKLKIKKDYIETYGKYKAKISNKILTENPIGALQYSITEGYAPLRDTMKNYMKTKKLIMPYS